MQNAELDKFVGADSISARFVGFLLIYGGVDFIFVGTDVLGGPQNIDYILFMAVIICLKNPDIMSI